MHSSRALVYRLGSSVSHLRCHSLQLLGHAKHTSAFLPPATAQTHRTTTPHKLCAASVRSFLDNNNSHKRCIQPTSSQNALGESAIRMKRKEGPRPSQFVTSQMPLTTYTSHYATPACSFLHCAHSHNSHPCCCLLLPPTTSETPWATSIHKLLAASVCSFLATYQQLTPVLSQYAASFLGHPELTSTLLPPVTSQTYRTATILQTTYMLPQFAASWRATADINAASAYIFPNALDNRDWHS